MPIPNHIPRCQYVRTNGTRCGSPALRKRVFCYYHYKASCPPPISCEITPVETADGIQIAIGNVLQALENDRIDVKKAIAMLYGLQTASSNLKYTNPQPHWEDVETELGPDEQEIWHKKIAVEEAKDLQMAEIKANLKLAREEREDIEDRLRQKKAEEAALKESTKVLDHMVLQMTR
jgi:hypothetical protein